MASGRIKTKILFVFFSLLNRTRRKRVRERERERYIFIYKYIVVPSSSAPLSSRSSERARKTGNWGGWWLGFFSGASMIRAGQKKNCIMIPSSSVCIPRANNNNNYYYYTIDIVMVFFFPFQKKTKAVVVVVVVGVVKRRQEESNAQHNRRSGNNCRAGGRRRCKWCCRGQQRYRRFWIHQPTTITRSTTMSHGPARHKTIYTQPPCKLRLNDYNFLLLLLLKKIKTSKAHEGWRIALTWSSSSRRPKWPSSSSSLLLLLPTRKSGIYRPYRGQLAGFFSYRYFLSISNL